MIHEHGSHLRLSTVAMLQVHLSHVRVEEQVSEVAFLPFHSVFVVCGSLSIGIMRHDVVVGASVIVRAEGVIYNLC